MKIAYLDTSVLLRILLNEKFKQIEIANYDKLISSELIEIEARRRINNMRLSGQVNEGEMIALGTRLELALESIDLIKLTRVILLRAKQTVGIQIRTLDYLHLCSALLWKETRGQDFAVLTHDIEFGRAAQVLGFETVGVVAEYFGPW